jgi:hypothetical protein
MLHRPVAALATRAAAPAGCGRPAHGGGAEETTVHAPSESPPGDR